MKLSTRGRYAVSAMFDLALNGGKNPVGAAEISKNQRIPLSYLEQILLKLKNGGLVTTVKGPSGGYRLAKEPGRISIGNIIEVADGPVALADCVTPGSSCPKSGCCSTRALWGNLSAKISAVFDATTLADLCEKEKR